VRALVVTQNVTVDGSIEMGDWFDPQGQGDQSDLLEELHRQDPEVTRSSPAVKPSKICAATGQSSRTTRVASQSI
jgi:hypothetical protein